MSQIYNCALRPCSYPLSAEYFKMLDEIYHTHQVELDINFRLIIDRVKAERLFKIRTLYDVLLTCHLGFDEGLKSLSLLLHITV